MTEADKREKVIRGLEANANPKTCETCAGEECPYYNMGGGFTGVTCSSILAADALALLKELEARELSESCDNCDEYDKEKHSCPKFCKVISETIAELKSSRLMTVEEISECPYRSDGGCWETMKRDALVLLKEQTERIQFLEKWTAYLEGGNPYEGTVVLTHDRNQG